MRTPVRLPLAALLLAGLAPGCGPPQVGSANRGLVESLATAVSAREPAWVAENKARIAERKAAGALPESEARALDAIILRAEAGDWDGASTLALALRDAQRPSSEDVAAAGRPKLRKPQQYQGAAPLKGRDSDH